MLDFSEVKPSARGLGQGARSGDETVGTEMKVQEIRAKARGLKLKNTFGLSKEELIRRIQRAEGNFDCFGTAKAYCDQFECCFREDCLKPAGVGRR